MNPETVKNLEERDKHIAELRALVADRLNWYTRSGRTPTMHSGVWIERARKALGYSEDRSE
jgi:hypothetical protein